jgi:hypothetical protein
MTVCEYISEFHGIYYWSRQEQGREAELHAQQAELLPYIMHMGIKDCLADLFMV